MSESEDAFVDCHAEVNMFLVGLNEHYTSSTIAECLISALSANMTAADIAEAAAEWEVWTNSQPDSN